MSFWSFLFSSDSPLYMWCLDVKCFERSLSGQADASFFTFGQFCRFLRKLCSRAVLPKCIPGDMDWTGMLYLCPDDLKLLSCRDFLHRLKLVSDIDLVCKAKIRQSRSDPNISANEFSGLLVAERDNFATNARGYFVFLLETILRDVHLTADIVHGLACFDPHTLVSLSMEQVTFCLEPFSRPLPFADGYSVLQRLIIETNTWNSWITFELISLSLRTCPAK